MGRNLLSRNPVLAVCAFVLPGVLFLFLSSVIYAADQPNIVIILADDMGWGDLCKNHNGPGCTTSYYCNRDYVPQAGETVCTLDSQCTPPTENSVKGCINTNTPHLDELADAGIRLTNFYTPSPVCAPARASLLTGNFPIRHGVTNNPRSATDIGAYLDPSSKTIAKVLKSLPSGAYSTGMVGKWHLGWIDGYYPNDQGFEYYYAMPGGVYWDMEGFNLYQGKNADPGTAPLASFCTNSVFMSAPTSTTCCTTGSAGNDDNYWSVYSSSTPTIEREILYDTPLHKKTLTQIITDEAIKFIKEGSTFVNVKSGSTTTTYRDSAKPFFLYVALPSPHGPLDVHMPGNTEGLTLRDASFKTSDTNNLTDCLGAGNALWQCAMKKQFTDENYSKVLKDIDTQVEKVLKELPPNTIVIFASDNGTDMGLNAELEGESLVVSSSTGIFRGGKRFLYEGGVRVPFIARRIPKAGKETTWSPLVSDQLADLTDLFPTLLTAATGTTTDPIDGDDLTTFLETGIVMDNKVEYYSTKPGQEYKPTHVDGDMYTWPVGAIHTTVTDTASPPVTVTTYTPPAYAFQKNISGLANYKLLFDLSGKKELYSLAIDTHEDKNLVLEDSSIAISDDDKCKAEELFNDALSTHYKFKYYLPSIKDNDGIGWENNISVKAREAVPMDVKVSVYTMNGTIAGISSYNNAQADVNKKAIKPNAKLDFRPSSVVVSSNTSSVEGSVIIETSVPAIVSANTIANSWKGFSINEAAKIKSLHRFPAAYDGPNNYQVYLLVQNIYSKDIAVSVKLYAKTKSGKGDGVGKIYTIPPHGVLKVRPSEVAPLDSTGKNIDFNGSVVVSSDLATTMDGYGEPIPAMLRVENGMSALAIYESTEAQSSLHFPSIRDGKFGGDVPYENTFHVLNSDLTTTATVTITLYNNAGIKEGSKSQQIAPNYKLSYLPSWIKGTAAAPVDFEGSISVTSDIPVMGLTSTLYPDGKAYDLLESSKPSPTLYFPKVFDNMLGSGSGATKLTENTVYVQNPDETTKNIVIEQFNPDGTPNGFSEVSIAGYATYVFKPRELVRYLCNDYNATNGTTSYSYWETMPLCEEKCRAGAYCYLDTQYAQYATFRGSIKITETTGQNITGAMKYEIHSGTTASTPIDSIAIYRSMGQ